MFLFRAHVQRAADVVVDAEVIPIAVLVFPDFLGLVAVLNEDCSGIPVVLPRITQQIASPFEQEDLLSR